MRIFVVVGVLMAALSSCGDAFTIERAESGTSLPGRSPSERHATPDSAPHFYPSSRRQDHQVAMPLTFVDGSSAEVVAPPSLGLQDMSAAVYTSGGLGRVDRTIEFSYNPDAFLHKGPLGTYEGSGGKRVEVWRPSPGDGCPNLVYRFGAWFVGVRTCQTRLSESEKQSWARLLRGEISGEGFIVLSARGPLLLTRAGGHEGPAIVLGMDDGRNWVQLMPGECDPATYGLDGDVRIMADGTRVSFARLEGGRSKIPNDWFVTWCEDGRLRVQIAYAYKGFAHKAAESLRLRQIVLRP